MMNYSDKVESFKKEIRRKEIDHIFSQKRIKLLEGIKQTQDTSMDLESEKEIMKLSDQHLQSAEELKRIAILAQTEMGIQVIHQAEYEKHLLKYLKDNFCNTDQQFYATYILCNLYYIPVSEPSELLTQEIMNMLDYADMRSLENIYTLIGNAISDFPSWFDLIMNGKEHFGDKLTVLYGRFHQPTVEYLNQLTRLVFKIVKKKGKHSSFLKLNRPLMRLMLQKEGPQVKQLMRNAVYSYYVIVKHFTQEMAASVTKFGVLRRLLELWSFFNERKIVHLTLEIIDLCMNEITIQQFQSLVIPYLIVLAERAFDVGEKSAKFQPRQLKILSYNIINKSLEMSKLHAQYFSSLKLAEIMLEQLRTSDDKQILISLSTIFTQVCLNTRNQKLLLQLKQLIQRANSISKSYELSVYLLEFERMI